MQYEVAQEFLDELTNSSIKQVHRQESKVYIVPTCSISILASSMKLLSYIAWHFANKVKAFKFIVSVATMSDLWGILSCTARRIDKHNVRELKVSSLIIIVPQISASCLT